MSEVMSTTEDSPEESATFGKTVLFLKVFFGRKVVLFGAIVAFCIVLAAIFAPLLAPYNPYNPDYSLPPLQHPSSAHLLGTDALGRDTFSRILYGARTSLLVSIGAITVASVIGMTLGMVAGYFGGPVQAVIMRFFDAIMVFPMIVLAMCIAALLGGGLKNVVIAIGIGMSAVYARMMCAQVLSIKESEYVTACRVIGAGNLRIMFRHILPNAFPPLIVLMTIQMGSAILAEAGLSFLGIGIEPPEAAWGNMVKDGYQYLQTNPLLSFAPGIAIMLVVLAFNMIGDGLRDTLDPRLRGKI